MTPCNALFCATCLICCTADYFPQTSTRISCRVNPVFTLLQTTRRMFETCSAQATASSRFTTVSENKLLSEYSHSVRFGPRTCPSWNRSFIQSWRKLRATSILATVGPSEANAAGTYLQAVISAARWRLSMQSLGQREGKWNRMAFDLKRETDTSCSLGARPAP